MNKNPADPPLFTAWYETVGLLLERVVRFPKNLRPTLGNRLLDRALDIQDQIVRLRYSKNRRGYFPRPTWRSSNCGSSSGWLLSASSFPLPSTSNWRNR